MNARIPVRKRGEIVAWALVDEGDFATLSAVRWSLNGSGYAMGTLGLMHRVILGLTRGEGEVDHVNRDKLDNRRSNLRLVSHSENVRNSARFSGGDRDRARISELWEAGLSRSDIATHLGCSYGFVCCCLRGEPGATRGPKLIWSRDKIAEFLQAFHAEHGRLPRMHEMDGRDGRPWFTVVYRRFDSLMEARAYAGFGAIDLRKKAA